MQLGRRENELAMRLTQGLQRKGCAFYAQSPTNQVFPILTKEQIQRLEADFTFELTAPVDENRDAVRFVTSWATPEEAVEALIQAL